MCVCQAHVTIIHGALDFTVKGAPPTPSLYTWDLTVQGPLPHPYPRRLHPTVICNVFLLTMPGKAEELDWHSRCPKIHPRVYLPIFFSTCIAATSPYPQTFSGSGGNLYTAHFMLYRTELTYMICEGACFLHVLK